MEASFDDLLQAADGAPIVGWDFGWLAGRAVEERPSWHYFERVAERAARVATMLDLQTGDGAMIENLPSLPRLTVATEGFPPNVRVAAPRLRAVGASLVETEADRAALPFTRDAFELVTSRHPVDVWWSEIARVLRPGGTYFAQHVGPHSLRELSEFFVGALPEQSKRDPEVERRGAEAAGLIVLSMSTERPRAVFSDVGAVVYFLRLVPWIVPGFSIATHRQRLRALHEVIVRHGGFETTASRVLVEATKRTPEARRP